MSELLRKTLQGLADGVNKNDPRISMNTLMETAGSDLRWEEDESWEDFRARAHPEIKKLKHDHAVLRRG